MSNNYTLIHEEVMAEDNLTYHDLTDEIQDMIDDIEELKQEYNEFPSEKGFDVLQRKSLEIADEIQSIQEAEFDESDEEDDYDENEGKMTPPPSYSKANWKFW
jgi:hypothetical protein